MMVAIELLKKIAPYLIVVAIVFASLFGAYRHGVTVTASKYQDKIDRQAAADAAATAALEAKVRQVEDDAAKQLAAVDANYQEKMKNEIDSRDAVIAGLRAGSVRVRERFTCASTASGVPNTAASAGRSDAAGGRGLQQADAEFLVSIAERADQVVLQLQACQAVVAADRSVPR